ncbi:hypothetical protein [Actinomadura formosensis]|uniref:hypothetical protein n=1 Tax=Actinomadura formosensis TaxID=60706 RepID=UPI003D8B8640
MLTTRVMFELSAELTAELDLASGSVPLRYPRQYIWGSGTGANSADKVFHDKRTLAASATEDLDLAGSLLDGFGQAITFARVRGLIVYAAPGNTNAVQVGGAAATQFTGWVADATDKVNVRPGGLLALLAPDATAYPVGAGASDLLRFGNGGGGTPVTYDVVIIGASA